MLKSMETYARNQDFTFVVSPIFVNDGKINPSEQSWTVELYINPQNKIQIDKRGAEIRSTGTIACNTEISDTDITIFAKTSKYDIGTGVIKGQFTLYKDSEDFEDNIQVIKSLPVCVDIQLV